MNMEVGVFLKRYPHFIVAGLLIVYLVGHYQGGEFQREREMKERYQKFLDAASRASNEARNG